MNYQKSIVKCEICYKEIKGKTAYVKTKKVCSKCFYNNKYSSRNPRTTTYFIKSLNDCN